MLMTVLLVLLVLALIGGVVPFGPWAGPGPITGPVVGQPGPAAPYVYHGYGFGPWGGVGLIVVVVLLLVLLGGV